MSAPYITTERNLTTAQLRRLEHRAPRPCLWCDEWLVWDPPADMDDPQQVGDWNVDGDYGCDAAPDTTEDGTGGHMTKEDVAAIVREVGSIPDGERPL
jgi:hypothetical protein